MTRHLANKLMQFVYSVAAAALIPASAMAQGPAAAQAEDGIPLPSYAVVRTATGDKWLEVPGFGGIVHAGKAGNATAVYIERVMQGDKNPLLHSGDSIRIRGLSLDPWLDGETGPGPVTAVPESATGRGVFLVEKVPNQSAGPTIRHGEQIYLRATGTLWLEVVGEQLTRGTKLNAARETFVILPPGDLVTAGGDPSHVSLPYKDVRDGRTLNCDSSQTGSCDKNAEWKVSIPGYWVCNFDMHQTTERNGEWRVKRIGNTLYANVHARGSGYGGAGGSMGIELFAVRVVRDDASPAQVQDSHCRPDGFEMRRP